MMRLLIDHDYESFNKRDNFRKTDRLNRVFFTDAAGYNQQLHIIKPHWHHWLEVTYILSGDMVVETPNEKLYIKAGDIVVIGMQMLHKIEGQLGHFRFQCLHVNMDFILQHISPNYLMDEMFVVSDKSHFLDLFSQVIYLINKRDLVSELRLESSLIALFAFLIEDGPSREIERGMTGQSPILSDILFFLGTHYQDNLTLNEVADKFDYTPQYITSLFKKHLGTSFFVYLTRLRLNKARFLLNSTSKKIIDIGYECGFSSEHAFISQFKKIFGVTPNVYRKNYNELRYLE